MNTPITTIVTNKLSNPLRIGTALTTFYIPANTSTETAGDIWSQCGGAQKRTLLGMIRNGTAEFTLRIAQTEDTDILVPYTEEFLTGAKSADTAEPVSAAPQKLVIPRVPVKDNIIKASDIVADNLAEGMGMKKSEAGKDTLDNEIRANAMKDSKILTDTKLEEQKVAPVEAPAEDAEVPPVVDDEKAPAEVSEEDKAKFDELCANRKWKDALELLKALLGEDKVTISSRVIQSNPSWDRIIAKLEG
jgi:hypothetical protein